jgi:mRNA interferase MazF
MEKFSVKDIVFIRFPFSDLSNYKLRPALILAYAEKNDWILCQITSQPYSDKQSVVLENKNFESGSLIKTSYIRPGKLFTANANIFEKKVARINSDFKEKIVKIIIKMLKQENVTN